MINRPPQTHGRQPRSNSLYMALFQDWEQQLLRKCLDRHRNNQCAVARELGLHRNTVRRMVRIHGLTGGKSA